LLGVAHACEPKEIISSAEFNNREYNNNNNCSVFKVTCVDTVSPRIGIAANATLSAAPQNVLNEDCSKYGQLSF
jgi:hypothetical protein